MAKPWFHFGTWSTFTVGLPYLWKEFTGGYLTIVTPPKMGKVWKGLIHHYFRFGFHQILCFLGLLEPEWMLCYLWFLNMTSYKWPSNRMCSFVQLRFWAAWVYRFAPSSFILGGIALENCLVVSNIFRFPNIADDDSISCLWDASKHRRNRNWPEQDIHPAAFKANMEFVSNGSSTTCSSGSWSCAGGIGTVCWQICGMAAYMTTTCFGRGFLLAFRTVASSFWNRTQKDRMIEPRYERNWALGGMFPGIIFCLLFEVENIWCLQEKENPFSILFWCVCQGCVESSRRQRAAFSMELAFCGLIRLKVKDGRYLTIYYTIIHYGRSWHVRVFGPTPPFLDLEAGNNFTGASSEYNSFAAYARNIWNRSCIVGIVNL